MSPRSPYDAERQPGEVHRRTRRSTREPKTLGVYPIIKGPGPVVKSGDNDHRRVLRADLPRRQCLQRVDRAAVPRPARTRQVIKGWDQGLVGQRVGSRVVLVIPPALGYGDKKQSGIPPNSTLIFTVQILSTG